MGTPAPALRGACPLSQFGVRDLRPDPDYLGAVANRPVVGTHLGTWLTSGLERSLAVSADDAAGLRMEVDLLKAYLISVSVSKSANIVVRARFYRGEELLGEQTLRGANTSGNMASTNAETLRALAQAMQELARGLRAAADGHCAGGAAAPIATAP